MKFQYTKFILLFLFAFISINATKQPIVKSDGNVADSSKFKMDNNKTETDPTISGEINGYKYVDLGLPSGIKWAIHNVDLKAKMLPFYSVSYYEWGEVYPRNRTVFYSTMKKFITTKKKIGNIYDNPQYDVARFHWGGTWRLPTQTEMQELVSVCKWSWTIIGKHKGYKVTGPNGNSIFLPAAGYSVNDSYYYVEEQGHYWTSTPNHEQSEAYCLQFGEDGYSIQADSYHIALSIRPVSI